MKNTLMKSLLKAKSDANKEVEDLIETYLRDAKNKNKAQTDAFVSELLVFIMQKLEQDVDKSILLDLVSSKISSLGYTIETAALEHIYEMSAVAVASSLSATFTFDKTDTQVLDSMYRALTWMKEDGAVNTQDKLKSIIGQAMKGEVNMADLGETLREGFEGVIDESARYFEGVSDHVIRQSQSVTRAYQFEKAGVESVKVVAVIDNRTSLICRSLHGRIISVKKVVGQADAITSAQSIDEKKTASRWQSQPIFGTLAKDVALPPYHFRCRTIVVAYFPQSVEIDGKNVNGSLLPGETYKGKEVLFSHIEPNFGYEVVVTDKTFSHEGNPHDVSQKQVIAGLNSMEKMALHRNELKRTVGYSKDKNLFFVFENGELWTVYDGTRKDYFKDNAEISTITTHSMKKGKTDEEV